MGKSVASVFTATGQLAQSWELLVVDDRKARTPPLQISEAAKILTTGGGIGFAAAANRGVQEARSELLLILNDDAYVDEACLLELVKAALERPDVAAFQPKILSAKSPGWFDYAGAAGGLIDRYGYPYCKGRILFSTEMDQGQHDNPGPIFWASGCALFIRKEAFQAAEGLDSTFVMHMEEIDLCWRLWRMEMRIESVPSAVVHHEGGATLPRISFRKSWWNHRNHWLLAFKNMPTGQLVRAIGMRIFLDWVEFLGSVVTLRWKNAAAVACAHLWPIMRARWLWRIRRRNRLSYSLPQEAPILPRSVVLANVIWRKIATHRG